jgi:hypothetical protein
MNLPVTLAILPEYDLEKLQLIMQAPELYPYAPRWKAWHALWMYGVGARVYVEDVVGGFL